MKILQESILPWGLIFKIHQDLIDTGLDPFGGQRELFGQYDLWDFQFVFESLEIILAPSEIVVLSPFEILA